MNEPIQCLFCSGSGVVMVNLLGFVKDLPTRCHVCQGAGEIQEPETIAEPEELTTLQLVKPNYPELFAL